MGLASARPSFSPLKFAPHKRPSQRTLNNYACFYSEILTKAPQQVWQTLKNFDYPLLTAKATDFFSAVYLF